ncbi:hypothetical protein [Thermosipho atlanticus]|uniref:Secretin and TonB N terminus short domain-containing protein n=1 Tax=Thermosipho atlanticus DSM 15807 TaxID=1123380 RepID=A0A1M5U680_9BACT|nr:hypothetical protein [Thermosipho atlanticus]SHH58459.1 hypothetical protein SAMN02745199_1645 [Thermosipho atlanticus DSM 15807]
MRKMIIGLFILLLFTALFAQTNDVVFQEVDIKDVLTQLGTMFNATIIYPNTISGNVNVILYNVSLETALKVILSPFNFSYSKVEDIFVVFSEDSLSYYVPHVYEPKNRSASSIVKVLDTLPIYAVGDNVIVYCPDSLWPEYLKRLQEIDTEMKNMVVSYVVYYVKNTDATKYNLKPEKLIDLFPVLEKAKFVLNTNGFFVGNNVKINIQGEISITIETASSKLKFNFQKGIDSAKYEVPFSNGVYKNILNGSFGKFVVLIKIGELKSKIEEKVSDVNYVPTKTIGLKYFSTNNFEIYLSDERIGAFILKDESYFVGAKLKLVDYFNVGAMVELTNATNLIITAEDSYYFEPFFIELRSSFPVDLSNLDGIDGQYLSENLKFGLGIGMIHKINYDLSFSGKISVDNDLQISGEIGIKYSIYDLKLYIDSLLTFGIVVEMHW